MTCALLIIDVQRAAFDVSSPPYEADAVVQRINGLASSARQAGAPVVFILHERAGTAFAYQGPGWQLERSLQPVAGDHFIRKTTPDSFLRTSLQELLAKLGVKHVVVCGYASEFCVDTTVRRAAGLGYSVTLAADAHTTHDKAHAAASDIRAHENATLPGMVSLGASVRAVPSAQVTFAADPHAPADLQRQPGSTVDGRFY